MLPPSGVLPGGAFIQISPSASDMGWSLHDEAHAKRPLKSHRLTLCPEDAKRVREVRRLPTIPFLSAYVGCRSSSCSDASLTIQQKKL
jgi:hypothetical protein